MDRVAVYSFLMFADRRGALNLVRRQIADGRRLVADEPNLAGWKATLRPRAMHGIAPTVYLIGPVAVGAGVGAVGGGGRRHGG